MMYKKKYTGWGVSGRAFTEKEFNKSHLKDDNMSYGDYNSYYNLLQEERQKMEKK